MKNVCYLFHPSVPPPPSDLAAASPSTPPSLTSPHHFTLPPPPPSALGNNLSWHHADVFGADGRRIGRVRYGFRFRKPLDSLVKQYKEWFRSKRPSEPHVADPAFIAVETVSGVMKGIISTGTGLAGLVHREGSCMEVTTSAQTHQKGVSPRGSSV